MPRHTHGQTSERSRQNSLRFFTESIPQLFRTQNRTPSTRRPLSSSLWHRQELGRMNSFRSSKTKGAIFSIIYIILLVFFFELLYIIIVILCSVASLIFPRRCHGMERFSLYVAFIEKQAKRFGICPSAAPLPIT